MVATVKRIGKRDCESEAKDRLQSAPTGGADRLFLDDLNQELLD